MMEGIRREDLLIFCPGFGGLWSLPRFSMVSRSLCDFQASTSPALGDSPSFPS